MVNVGDDCNVSDFHNFRLKKSRAGKCEEYNNIKIKKKKGGWMNIKKDESYMTRLCDSFLFSIPSVEKFYGATPKDVLMLYATFGVDDRRHSRRA